MKVLVIGFNFRNIDNFSPVLDKVIKNGGDVKLIVFPYLADPSYKKIQEFKHQKIIERPISCLSEASMCFKELFLILNNSFHSYLPDVIFIDDIRAYPSSSVLKALKQAFFCKNIKAALKRNEFKKRPPVIVFQHGLFQEWDNYNKNFACDYLFTYGDEHRAKIKPKYRNRVFSSGLPKLDRLKEIKTEDHNYILFIAQNDPEGKHLKQGLENLSTKTGKPVLIKPHPQHKYYYSGIQSENVRFIEEETNILGLIAKSSFVITTGSTSGIEALLLNKKLVVLPSLNSSAYDKELFVTNDYTADEMLRVLNEQDYKNDKINDFIINAIKTKDFNSADITYENIVNILQDFKG